MVSRNTKSFQSHDFSSSILKTQGPSTAESKSTPQKALMNSAEMCSEPPGISLEGEASVFLVLSLGTLCSVMSRAKISPKTTFLEVQEVQPILSPHRSSLNSQLYCVEYLSTSITRVLRISLEALLSLQLKHTHYPPMSHWKHFIKVETSINITSQISMAQYQNSIKENFKKNIKT